MSSDILYLTLPIRRVTLLKGINSLPVRYFSVNKGYINHN